MKLTKKAAMFGLDARIALAIFGALSVISGAALYSAIQQSKVTAIITEFEELGKANDQYFLDNTKLLPFHATVKYLFLPNRLLENIDGLLTWNGPYTSKAGLTTNWLSSKYGAHDTLQYRPGTDWGGVEGSDTAPPAECTTAPCYIYISTGVISSSFAEAVDLQIDNASNAKQGKVRLWNYTVGANAGKSNIYYQYSIAPVQP